MINIIELSKRLPDQLWASVIILSNGRVGATFLVVSQPEREADYSPLSNAEVNNDRAITPLSHYINVILLN
jgi:hypothetical protein